MKKKTIFNKQELRLGISYEKGHCKKTDIHNNKEIKVFFAITNF
jgi:hypothetical protein